MQKILIIGCLSALFLSCKKENNNEDPQANNRNEDYLMLKKGNYWVYEQREYINYTVSRFLSTDSIFVTGDTIIDGNTFARVMVKEGSHLPQLYGFFRDSLDYTIKYPHHIVFSANNFKDTFQTRMITAPQDTIAIVYTKMAEKDLALSYPAGIFTTYTFREIYFTQPGWDQLGKERYRDMRYAKGIGLVYENLGFYNSANLYMARRLVRYNVR